MSVISKDLAGKIAYKLTEKSRLAAERLHVDFREAVTALYEKKTPKEISDLLKKHGDWIRTSTTIRLNGNGFSYEYVTATRKIINMANSDNYLEMTNTEADKLVNAKRKWEAAVKKYNLLKSDAEQAILTLKTFNNIRKELPEAAAMLPPPLSNALVVDFSSLKKQLAHQQEEKKEVAAK